MSKPIQLIINVKRTESGFLAPVDTQSYDLIQSLKMGVEYQVSVRICDSDCCCDNCEVNNG